MRIGRVPRWAAFPVAVAVVALTLTGCENSDVVSGGDRLKTSGGKITVECVGRWQARIAGTHPAEGFTARIIVGGPAYQVSMIFESPEANDVKIISHCVDQEPRFFESEIEDTTISG